MNVQRGLRVALAPTWYDVDNINDLARLALELKNPSQFGRHTRAFLNNTEIKNIHINSGM